MQILLFEFRAFTSLASNRESDKFVYRPKRVSTGTKVARFQLSNAVNSRYIN